MATTNTVLEGKWSVFLKIMITMFPVATAIGGFIAVKTWNNGTDIAATKTVADLNAEAIGKMASSIAALDSRVRAIESNRYTSADAAENERRDAERFLEIWKIIGNLKEEMATFPKEIPPKWFVDEFRRLEKKVDTLIAKKD